MQGVVMPHASHRWVMKNHFETGPISIYACRQHYFLPLIINSLNDEFIRENKGRPRKEKKGLDQLT